MVWHAWICVISLSIALVGSVWGSQGVRQRNSSLPLRDVGAERSKSVAFGPSSIRRRNQHFNASNIGLEERSDCPFCDVSKCLSNGQFSDKEGDSVLCIITRRDENGPVEEICAQQVQISRLLHYEIDAAEGCRENSKNGGWEICWCRHTGPNDSPNDDKKQSHAVSINSRFWKVKNTLRVRASRLSQTDQSMHSSSQRTFTAFGLVLSFLLIAIL